MKVQFTLGGRRQQLLLLLWSVMWLSHGAGAAVDAFAEAPTREQLPEGLVIESVSVWPEKVMLDRPWQAAQILLTGQLASGETVDLTRMAVLRSEPTTVRVSSTRSVEALADGEERLEFEVAGRSVEVPVVVSGTRDRHAVSYVQHVTPVLSKMGCNSGTCHGSKDGQRGFKLSLRGYDALYDHQSLTDDIGARRFNRVNPDQSLMLLKASGSIPHVGGMLTQPGERRYDVIRRWIAQGATLDLDAPRVVSIELQPANPIVPREQMSQQLVVLAKYQDGTVRDVTADAFIESGNIEVLSADKNGMVTTLRRGEAPVLARYEGAYTATTVTVMGDRTGFEWQQPPVNNYIDEFVYEKLKRVRVLPSDLCSDEEFVRRVYLDLTGLPPKPEEIRGFLADARGQKEKRDALIDRLVGSPSYVEHWTNKWADMLQVNRKFLGDVGAAALRDWIQNAIASNMPYDRFAYEVMTATGSTLEHPAAAYWKVLREPAGAMENTTHLFLAVRFNCNKCHDHPFERWTQDQYYHLTAFFSQVGRKEDPTFSGQRIGGTAVESAVPLVEVIYDTGSGETTHERTGQVAKPSFPYPIEGSIPEDVSRREQLARWITSPENRYFASSYVNRIWGYLLGVGLIEPIDDIRAGNPPTNPELLKALTEEFVKSGFDVQHMIRTICKSRVYQHSVASNRWNQDDTINYSHALPRRLPAEVLFDAIHVATGATPRIPGAPAGFRAAQLPDAGTTLPFLDDFGRPPRESSCECERSSGIVLGPVMKLINGPTVNDAIVDPQNGLKRLVDEHADDRMLVEEVFLRFLSRYPTDKEMTLGLETLQAAKQDEVAAREKLQSHEASLLAKQAEWEANQQGPVQWHALQSTGLESSAGAQLVTDSEGVITVTGPRAVDVYTLTAPTALTSITGIRLEALPDASLPAGGPGRADNGNFVVNELEVQIVPAGGGDAQVVALREARADFSQDAWDVRGAIDGNAGSGWAIMPQFNQIHTALFQSDPVNVSPGSTVRVRIHHAFQEGTHNLGRFRLALTGDPQPLTGERPAAELAQLLQIPVEKRSAEQAAEVRRHFLEQDVTYRQLRKSLEIAAAQSAQYRLTGVQDLAWALINTPAFLFNR